MYTMSWITIHFYLSKCTVSLKMHVANYVPITKSTYGVSDCGLLQLILCQPGALQLFQTTSHQIALLESNRFLIPTWILEELQIWKAIASVSYAGEPLPAIGLIYTKWRFQMWSPCVKHHHVELFIGGFHVGFANIWISPWFLITSLLIPPVSSNVNIPYDCALDLLLKSWNMIPGSLGFDPFQSL